jgi:hypothetical protein
MRTQSLPKSVWNLNSPSRLSFITTPPTQDLESCSGLTPEECALLSYFGEEDHDMRDPTLWTSWYVVLLLFPFMIVILLLCDFLTGRRC